MPAIFEAICVSHSFGGPNALTDVSLGIAAGEIHAIIGENGAGKSTLMNIFSGRLTPQTGSLTRNGQTVKFTSPHDAQAASIAIAPQEINLVTELTVGENIVLGAQPRTRFGNIDWAVLHKTAFEALSQIDDTIDTMRPVRSMPKAQQQLVQVARAVASGASILIFDEPTAALADREATRLLDFIVTFRDAGGSAFYISHRLDEILAFSDRISVLRDGHLVATLDPKRTTKDEMVHHMAGRDVEPSSAVAGGNAGSDVVLAVDRLTRRGEFDNVTFSLHRGEILGIAGLVGSGRTEIGTCLFGVTKPDAGLVTIFGKPILHATPASMIAAGFAYLPEERKQDGIIPLLSVAENVALPSYAMLSSLLRIDFKRVLTEVRHWVQEVSIKVTRLTDPIRTLSGGNQQKAILARWLMRDAKVLFLDEPTRGIDVNAKQEIRRQLAILTRKGVSIIYVSSELQEVLDVSDRVLVIHEGRLKGEVVAAGTTPEDLLRLAVS